MATVPKKNRTTDPGQVSQVEKWIVAGSSSDDVADAIRSNFPGSDPATLMLAAMARFRDVANFEPSIVLGFVFEGVREVYRRANEAADYSTALRALKQLEGMARYALQNRDDDNGRQGQEDGAGVDDDTDGADLDHDRPDCRQIAGDP